jgi:hypothetical protein
MIGELAMKALLTIAIAVVPLFAFGAEQRQQKSHLNPADFSTNRQNCNLITAVISYVPTWRDNQVPIERAHRSIEDILIKIAAEDADKLLWHNAVDRLYGSKVTTKEMEAELRPMCEKIP